MSLVPRASKGLWMTLGKCKKFQSRRTGRVNVLSKMIFFFWCFLIQLPTLQLSAYFHMSFFSPVPKQYFTQYWCSGVESLALCSSVRHHGELCRQAASCLCCLQRKGPYSNRASYLGGKRAGCSKELVVPHIDITMARRLQLGCGSNQPFPSKRPQEILHPAQM